MLRYNLAATSTWPPAEKVDGRAVEIGEQLHSGSGSAGGEWSISDDGTAEEGKSIALSLSQTSAVAWSYTTIPVPAAGQTPDFV